VISKVSQNFRLLLTAAVIFVLSGLFTGFQLNAATSAAHAAVVATQKGRLANLAR